MLVARDKLDETSRTRLKRLSGGGDDLEIDRFCSTWRDSADFPGGCLTDTDFGLADTGRFLATWNCVTDEAGHFEFPRSLERD